MYGEEGLHSRGLPSYSGCVLSDGLLLHLLPGLFVGKEGPMIHSGAVVGAGLPQVRLMGGEGKSLTVVSRESGWKKSIGSTLT